MTTKRPSGIAFVGTPLKVECKLPFRLGPDAVFARAKETEIRKIKKYLESLGGAMSNCEAFENEYNHTSMPSPIDDIEMVSIDRKPLPKDEWCYHVIRLTDCKANFENHHSQPLSFVRVASHLTTDPLYINPLFIMKAYLSDFTADWEYFTDIASSGGSKLVIGREYLKDWKQCYTNVRRVTVTHPAIAHSIGLYRDLPGRLGYNELTTLALFAVLESLITHNPIGAEDSIGHQIRTKVNLLAKRLSIPIDYSGFGEATAETIWKRLYEFRSRIAHGSPLDFDRKLALLKDAYTVELFLRRAVQCLIRGALEEPDLFVDLKRV